MNTAEWILVMFLSVALLIFLILAIVLTVKLIGITKEVKKIVIKGQDIADKADDIVENVKGMTSVGGLVKTLVNKYTKTKDGKKPQ
jgi:biopolymer transport protein ExbB/TolQ